MSWFRKGKGATKNSSYLSEFCAGQVSTEEAIYMAVKGPTALCGDKLGMILSITKPDYELKNKHVAISYQKLRESAAAGISNPLRF